MRRRWPTLLAAAALSAGCAGLLPQSGTTNLGGPWRPEPFAVADTILLDAERACRRDLGGMVRPDNTFVVADARGDGVLLVAFAGPASAAMCEFGVSEDGKLHARGGGSSESSDPWPRLGPTDVETQGVGISDDGVVQRSSTTGRAGALVARVEIVTPAGLRLRASLGRDGWFAAWWPAGDEQIVVEAYDASGALVGSSP
jgi:hypothetical protein